jgi:thiamine-phosphate pyrophosphorylase
MDLPRLVAITDLSRFPLARTLEIWALLCSGARPGSVAVQLRGPDQPARRLLELGRELADVARAAGQFLIVNDRLDLGRLLEADGVHLGEGGVSSVDARTLGPFRWIFRACHAPDTAGAIDADALVLSPILAPRKGAPALGLTAIERARAALERRGSGAVFALGGITPETAATCCGSGAQGVAAIGGLFGGPAPAEWLQALAIARDPGKDAEV